MKTFIPILIVIFALLSGCATLDTIKKDIQGQICPECKPIIIEKTTPCPEPEPAATLEVKKPKHKPAPKKPAAIKSPKKETPD
jgi:hypothetical protein